MSNLKKQLALANPLYWPAWFGIGVLWLITRLPVRLRIRFGKAVGRLIYALPGKLKQITETNIKLCFPTLSEEKQKTCER